MSQRSRINRNKKKKRSTGRTLLKIFLLFLLLFVLAGGYVIWQVYNDLQSTTEEMYEEVEGQEQHTSRKEKPVVVDDGEDPFSVLIMGVDTGDGRVETGRSDTMMLLTVNPNTDKTSIVSIPRDTYTEIIGRGHKDKINHAYAFGGTGMAMNTVQNLFDIPVDYFVSVNMDSMQQIVDAVGGITVLPPISFTQSPYTFVEGQATHMDGAKALSYSRMRKSDPNGDYGRQHRQRQVIEGTMKSIASLDSIMNYRNILGTLGNSMKTNMSFDDMVDMFNNYRGSVSNVDQVQLSGSGQMIGGVYYEIIPDEEINRVSSHLKTELELN